ncbi:Rtp1p ASCRUDRAFT_39993 [Ascoidea rubescens DSM 1968]|uniref:RNA polymerase II assembly factor Rtp1 C-terminal domain-containing protein n=1 Tax=Ascoidea rubescens DSM 1968 TaxID=1344418 RepID=A0A1D2V8X7_9ASCO|nr:hypothetical protein ASCRUDRAFT_39993 [Ascoidea rubescens DSM 1968]ODV58078.1 hypothetical protein ASCRUDRAFT_39993 [Ascoidea rubescens DSM 1968]
MPKSSIKRLYPKDLKDLNPSFYKPQSISKLDFLFDEIFSFILPLSNDELNFKKNNSAKLSLSNAFQNDNIIDLLFDKNLNKLENHIQNYIAQRHNNNLDYTLNHFDKRFIILDKLLNYLLKIDQLSKLEKSKSENKHLITISLQDLKIFGDLLNLIIIQGIYPSIPSNILISLNKRQLNNSNNTNAFDNPLIQKFKKLYLKYEKIPDSDLILQLNLLTNIISKFDTILLSDSTIDKDGNNLENCDVKKLLLPGIGYSDILISYLYLISNPSIQSQFDFQTISHWKTNLDEIESLKNTYDLFQFYSLILNNANSPIWFKNVVKSKLSYLIVKRIDDGVFSLLDFICELRESDDIDIEKIDRFNKILLAKPKNLDPKLYFTNIGNQIYNILIRINDPLITSIASNFVQSLFAKNKFIIHNFFFKRIWFNFSPHLDTENFRKFKENYLKSKNSEDSNNNNMNKDVIVDEAELNNTINVILSLSKNSNENVLSFLFNDSLILSLWNYIIFCKKTKRISNIGVITDLFKIFFTLTSNINSLDLISKNLFTILNDNWSFGNGDNGLVCIKFNESVDEISNQYTNEKLIGLLDMLVETFIDLLKKLDNDDLIQKQFSLLLKRWLPMNIDHFHSNLNSTKNEKTEKLVIDGENENDFINPFTVLIDLKLLEEISNKFKDKLLIFKNDKSSQNALEILDIIKKILEINVKKMDKSKQGNNIKSSSISHIIDNNNQNTESDDNEEDSDDEDESLETSESLNLVLELLSAILYETDPKEFSADFMQMLKSMKSLLKKLSLQNHAAKSLLATIIEMTNVENNKAQKGISNKKLTEEQQDIKIFSKAISNLTDPLVPIRAQSFYLIRKLIIKESPVISLEYVLNLHLIHLKDEETFIFLNVIKGLDSLIEFNKDGTLPKLMNIYKDDASNLDYRLKIGEVILRAIKRLGEVLKPELLNLLSSTLLENKIKSIEQFKSDNRLRMSSMSILGQICQINPYGIQSSLADAFDCVIGILEMETKNEEMEAIMRRSAIVLVSDLISGPGGLIGVPKGYGKKVLKVLKYIKDTDGDLLVRDQAEDTIALINNTVLEAFIPIETRK